MSKIQTLSIVTEKTIRSLIITLTGLIVILLVTHIAVMNNQAQKGYTLQQAKLRHEELQSENTTITTQLTNSATTESIQNNNYLKQMEKKEEKTYLEKKDNDLN